MRNQRAQITPANITRSKPTSPKRTTAPPINIHTKTTELAGIASNEQRLARMGESRGRGVSDYRVTTVGRILARLTVIGVVGSIAVTGGAAATMQRASSATEPATSNGIHAYGFAGDLGPSPSTRFNKPLVAMAPTQTGEGYFLTASDGGVFAFGDAQFKGSTGNLKLDAPVTSIATTPRGTGYWLAAKDGGVFTFGDATFYGSAAGVSIEQIVGIAPTPSGSGYWLVAKDGGVFTFGDAHFYGSVAQYNIPTTIVGMAPTKTGKGYTVLAADGGVFTFGDAKFRGSAYASIPNDAVGIATIGNGYAIARKTGSVLTYGTKIPAIGDLPNASTAPTVALAANDAGYWTVQGTNLVDHMNPFLVCTRRHESSPTPPAYDDGYGAINPSGRYFGAYQFDRSTWNNTARHAGRPDLVGVTPSTASIEDQDALAWDLFQWQGYAPWVNRCQGLK